VLHSPLYHWSDSIVSAPYGFREATERIGSNKQYVISEEHAENHIPSKVDYTLSHIFSDLLSLAARHLTMNGRLVAWIPIRRENPPAPPSHPALTLIGKALVH